MARLGALAALAIIVLLFSCPPPTLDPAYLDSTANFIAAYPLDNSGAVQWELAYLDQDGGYAYVTYAPAGTVGANGQGLPTATPAYKLSIADLFSNGDFEATAAGTAPAGWEQWRFNGSTWASTGITAAVVQDATSYHNRSLSYNLTSKDALLFRLPTMLPSGGVASAIYDLRFSARGVSFSDGRGGIGTLEDSNLGIDDTIGGGSFAGTAIRDLRTATGGSATAVMFGSLTNSQAAILDDVRAVRSDLNLYLRLRLRPTDTTPSLIEGYYRFSVWVRRDAPDRYLSDLTASGPLSATALTLWICSLDPTYGEEARAVIATAAGSTPAWAAGWTQIHVDFNKSARFDETSAAPVLELRIMPADINSPDATGILIAAPTLTFYSSGY